MECKQQHNFSITHSDKDEKNKKKQHLLRLPQCKRWCEMPSNLKTYTHYWSKTRSSHVCPAEPHFLPKKCLFFSPKWPLSPKSPVNRDIYVCFRYTASLSDSSETMISWQRKCLERKWFCRALTIQKNVHEQSFFFFFLIIKAVFFLLSRWNVTICLQLTETSSSRRDVRQI